MNITIQPSKINGTVIAPASKSSMQRACAAALLRRGTTIIHNPGSSNDDLAALSIIEALGATVKKDGDTIIIESDGRVNPVVKDGKAIINCGESGLSIRMFTPIAALAPVPVTITGEGSLEGRPMDFFDAVLPQLGVQVQSNQGKLPLTVSGPLQPRDITIDGSLSSQFLTGLLMAYAGAEASGQTITVTDLKSKPYIDLTLDTMRAFGMAVPEVDNNHYRYISAAREASSQPLAFTVEGDWSGGAFLLVAGAIAGPVLVRGLDAGSSQADKAILDALMLANAGLAIEAKGIRVQPSAMNGFHFDATDCPDLFPPLVALAAYCGGKTTIRGVNRLTHKESNRALTLQDEFDKMGVTIDLDGDVMTIYGGDTVKGADLYSHHDHRIAMAGTVAALRANSETVIEDAMAVRKSYPRFYRDLRSLGATISSAFELPGNLTGSNL